MVVTRKHECTKDGHRPYVYSEYLGLLESAAATYDSNKASKSGMGCRTAFNAIMNGDEDANRDGGTMSEGNITGEIMEFAVHQMQRSILGSKMNKETWTSLSDETKKVWDQISDKDKKAILSYTYERANREANIMTKEDT